jgi:hypothetical protein
VMDFHRLRINVGFQRVVRVREFGEFVSHKFFRFGQTVAITRASGKPNKILQ